MSDANNARSKASKQSESYARLLASGNEWFFAVIIAGLLVGVTLQITEFFLIEPAAKTPFRSALIALLWLYPLFALNCLQLASTWVFARRYFRETFALSSCTAIMLLLLIFPLTFYCQIYPWNLPQAFALLASTDVSPPAMHGVSLALFAVLSWGFVQFLYAGQRSWPGRRSKLQVYRDAEHGTPSLVGEALFEFKRRVRWGPALEEYLDPREQFDLNLPAEPIRSLAWVDQACELVRLTSPAYSFRPRISASYLEELDEQAQNEAEASGAAPEEAASDWHDRPAVWIGRNRQSKGAIALIPSSDGSDLARLEEQIAYARQMAQQRDQRLEEVLVAVRDGQRPNLPARQDVRLRIETEQTLLEQTVNLDDYRSLMAKRLRRPLSNTNLTLNDVYVSLRGKVAEQKSPVEAEEYIRQWLAEPGSRHLALLGSYGQGKSSFALMLTQRMLARSAPDLPPRIPILIELRGRNLRNLKPYALLGQWAGRYGMNGQALVRLHEAGRLLLIFDGFDEMAYLADLDMRMSYFRALWEFARYPNAKILISGRPNLFEDQGEFKQALNLRTAFSAGSYCEPVYLERLSIPEIQTALRSHPPHVREHICRLAGENRAFSDLVARPSLLQLVAAIWDEPEMRAIATAPTSAGVMRAFVHSTHRRQTEKEERLGEFMKLTEAERVYFMGGVALAMAGRGDTTIEARQLGRLTDQLRLAMPDELTATDITLPNPPTPLRVRLKNPRTKEDDPLLIERVKTEVRASSLLENEPDNPGILKFGHKSFLEYIYAEEISHAIRDARAPRSRALLSVTKTSVASILDQPEALAFLAELLIMDAGGSKVAANQLATASDAEQLEVGRRLLQVIVRLPRWNVFRKMILFFVCNISLSSSSSSLSSLLFLLFLLLLLLLPLPSSLLSLLSSLLSLSLFLKFLLSKFLLSLKIRKNIALWFLICKQLGLRDHVFFAETGLSIVPWLRGKPFPDLAEGLRLKWRRGPRPPIAIP